MIYLNYKEWEINMADDKKGGVEKFVEGVQEGLRDFFNNKSEKLDGLAEGAMATGIATRDATSLRADPPVQDGRIPFTNPVTKERGVITDVQDDPHKEKCIDIRGIGGAYDPDGKRVSFTAEICLGNTGDPVYVNDYKANPPSKATTPKAPGQ